MDNRAANVPRLVIYGMGWVGQNLARFAIEKNWPIVAAYNRAGAKVGQDVGRLVGLDRDIGVVVMDCDTADFSTLKADVGLVAMTDRMEWNFPAYQRLIGAGLNVLCHGADCYHPLASNGRAIAAQVDAMARAKGVTFTGGGVWDMSRIWSGIMAAGPAVRIDSLFHSSLTDAPRQGIHHLSYMGWGMTPEEFRERIGVDGENKMSNMYVLALVSVMEHLGYTVTRAEEYREPILRDEPYYVKSIDLTMEPGKAIGTRFVVEIDTAEGVPAIAHIDLRPAQEGEIEEMNWVINGYPKMEIRVKREDSAVASSASLFNRIPDVIAARPGIVKITEMGPLRPSALLGRAPL
jgi:2,4-diaminopentanoate dehydrogenase